MSGYSDILDGVSVSLALIVPPDDFDRVLAEYPPDSDGYPQPQLLAVLARSKFTFINEFGVPATGAPDVDYIRDIFNTWLITTSQYAAGIHRALALAVTGETVRTNATVGGIDGSFRDWDWEFTYFRTAADEPRFLITGRNITKRLNLVRSRTEYERQLELILAERQAAVADTEHSLDAVAGLVLSLVALRDQPTASHMQAVADFSAQLGEQLAFGTRQRAALRAAGMMHNVGMLGVPSDLLTKPTPLSAVEEMVLKEHARIGADLLAKSGFESGIVEAVLHHHERWDGSGYPDGLAGEAINLEARILAVADAVETMRRPIQNRAMPAKAIAEALKREAGVGHDPDLVEAAVAVLMKTRER